ncbi:MAG: AtpZ/AtpI family protein [Cytophagaceae bacterium]
MEPKDSEKKKPLNSYIKYSGMAVQMIVTMVLGAWAGMKLDAHFQVKSHLFTIFLLLFAVVASIYLVIKSLMNNND